MDYNMREYISLFEKKEDIDSYLIDDILVNESSIDDSLTISLNEAIEKLHDYFYPQNYSDDISVAYADGVYHGIEVSVNILKSILNKRES